MSVETHRVVIGAYGWKHSSWFNDFYDEDLPQEWQLGFYANEFPVVYVPATDWLGDENMDLSQWAEEVADSFRFLLEVPADLLNDAIAYSAALERAKGLNEFCLGLVLVVNQTVCDDIALLSRCIEKAKAVSMVCVDAQNIVLTEQINEVLARNAISTLWDGQESEVAAKTEEDIHLSVTRISSHDLTMPDLRKVLERCLAQSGETSTSVLIFDGEPPLIEVMRNADTLLNLL